MDDAVQLPFFLRKLLPGQVREQAADRIFHRAQDFSILHDCLAAADLDQIIHGLCHILKVGSHNDHIVVVMPHGGRDGPSLEMEPSHKCFSYISVDPIPLHLRNVEHILGNVAFYYAVFHIQHCLPALGDRDPRKRIHHLRLHLFRPFRRIDLEAVRRDRIFQMGRIQQAWLVFCLRVRNQALLIVHDLFPSGNDTQHFKCLCPGGDIEIRPFSRRQSADLIIQVERAGRV